MVVTTGPAILAKANSNNLLCILDVVETNAIQRSDNEENNCQNAMSTARENDGISTRQQWGERNFHRLDTLT